MAANQYGIDLGQLYSTKEAVEGARTQNRLSELRLGEAERQVAERPKKEAAAKNRKNLMAEYTEGALSGDGDSLNKLYALDVDTAAKVADRVDSMSEKEKEQAKANRKEIAQMSAWIASAETPEEARKNFDVVVSNMPEETQEKMLQEVERFDGDVKRYATYSLARVKDIDTIFDNPKVARVGNEDVVYKGGREIERKKRPEKDAGKDGVKTSEENLMYKQAIAYFGGYVDPRTNKITGVTQNQIPRAQAIAAEATKIYKNGNVGRSEAVELAAEKYGIQPANQKGAPPQQQPGFDPNDPLGLR